MKSANTAIHRSISHNEIVTVAWQPGIIEYLATRGEDGAETESVVEFWGNDPGEWRVHVDIRSRGQQIALMVKDLVNQDLANPEGDSYAAHYDAKRAVEAWYTSAGQAGDLTLCQIVDEMGVRYMAQEYQGFREDAEREAK